MPSVLPTLEIFTDCTCPWCYFMSERIARLKETYLINIHRRMFPFRADTPKEGLSVTAFFSDDPFNVEERLRNLQNAARALNVPFNPPEMIYNSRSAQEAGLWAESKGKGDVFLEALYTAYFVDSRNIAEPSVLADVAASVGLPGNEMEEVLRAATYRDRVARDWAMAETFNIMVLPTFIMNGNRLVGAQPFHKLQRLVENSGALKREKTGQVSRTDSGR